MPDRVHSVVNVAPVDGVELSAENNTDIINHTHSNNTLRVLVSTSEAANAGSGEAWVTNSSWFHRLTVHTCLDRCTSKPRTLCSDLGRMEVPLG